MKGRAELGGYMSTGNTENIGLTAAIEVKREALEWRHKLRLQADYQESLGLVTRERYLAAYEPNWKFDDRAYMYGAAQYESDRFSGFYDRISVSTGAGYSAIKSPAVKLDLELGPAFRHTRFIDDTIESNVAARGSMDFGLEAVTEHLGDAERLGLSAGRQQHGIEQLGAARQAVRAASRRNSRIRCNMKACPRSGARPPTPPAARRSS